MMSRLHPESRDRARSAAAVGLLHALIGYVLLTGLGYGPSAAIPDKLKLVNIAAPQPPARLDLEKKAREARPRNEEGAASPANLRNTSTQIVAPPPEIRLPVPPPIPAAPVAGQGSAIAAGAANVPGPGTGSGGIGNGLGGGRFGNGTGSGGFGRGGDGSGVGGRAIGARWLSGGIDNSDYPDNAPWAGRKGTVHLRFTVVPSGRISDCTVTRSSGTRELDDLTCRLLVSRVRYRPARTAEGVPIASTITGRHVWYAGRPPPDMRTRSDIEAPGSGR